MIILIHSSKTMKQKSRSQNLTNPELITKSKELHNYLKTLSESQLAKVMSISPSLAENTHQLISSWTTQAQSQTAAVNCFLGDIYSGLQVDGWTDSNRAYANKSLRILSGLYGILRPYDGIYPYRCEMGYKFPNIKYSSLYIFWGSSIADTLPESEKIINLSAVEYSKTITEYINKSRIITPNFLTISPKTNKPTFVVVHAKIARGAYAGWLIRNRVGSVEKLSEFTYLGYKLDAKLSTPDQPVFVCKKFGGIGMSVRLK